MAELNYRRIPTDYNVYKTLVRNEDGTVRDNMAVFSSYTNIVENGVSTIFTEWGIRGTDIPLVGAETKYESELAQKQTATGTFYDKEIEGTRTNEYWLCAAYLENDDE